MCLFCPPLLLAYTRPCVRSLWRFDLLSMLLLLFFFARWSSPHQCCQSSRCNQPANPAYLLLLAYTLKRKHAHTQVRWLTDRTDHHHTLRCEWAWACVALRCYSAHHLQICFFSVVVCSVREIVLKSAFVPNTPHTDWRWNETWKLAICFIFCVECLL